MRPLIKSLDAETPPSAFTADMLWSKCRAAGLRPSASRLAVFELLLVQHELKTADDIHAAASLQGSEMPMSSIYRALKDLEDVGFVERRELGRGRARFGLKTSNALYLQCKEHLRAIAIPDALIRALQETTNALGYDMLGHEITLIVSEKRHDGK